MGDLLAKHEALREAFMPWIRKDFPEANSIGDVVLALQELKHLERNNLLQEQECNEKQ